MKIEIEVVKPNLQVIRNQILFGIEPEDTIFASRIIDAAVEKYIGALKVRESDLETVQTGKSKSKDDKYIVPLKEFLDVKEKKDPKIEKCITTKDYLEVFGLSHIIKAKTYGEDLRRYLMVRGFLEEPNKQFDELEEYAIIPDREKSLKEMKNLVAKLNSEMPNNYAELYVIPGQMNQELKVLGCINFIKLKEENNSGIEETKSKIIEGLKEVDGPCLSLDALSIFNQATRLANEAPELVSKYGDVLTGYWKERLFRFDP